MRNILFILSFMSLLMADEIVIWQAFSKNIHNTNTDVAAQPFNFQGKISASKNITKAEVIFYRYESETRRSTLDLYYKNKMEAVFQVDLTQEANESDVQVLATLEGGSTLSKSVQLASSHSMKNSDFANYTSLAEKRVHRDAVNAMAFSRNNRYLVTGGDDNYARILEAKTLKTVHDLRGHRGYVKSIAITPDNKYVLSGGKDGTVQVWDIQTGKKIKVISAHKNTINAIAISNSGKYAVTCSTNARVSLWDLSTYKKVLDYPSSNGTISHLSATFTSDDRYTIIGDSRGAATFFTAMGGTYVKILFTGGPVTGLAMTRNMRHLYLGDSKGGVKWVNVLLRPHVDDPVWRAEYDLLWTAFFKLDQISIGNYGSHKAYFKIYYGHPINGYSPASIMYLNTTGDGKFIMYVGKHGKMRISETDNGFGRYSTSLRRQASSGAFSYDGRLSAIGQLDGRINVFGLP